MAERSARNADAERRARDHRTPGGTRGGGARDDRPRRNGHGGSTAARRGTPVAAAGEVHDGGDWGRIAAGGSRDLRALGRMFALIAEQPNLRWMNVETTAPGITFGSTR